VIIITKSIFNYRNLDDSNDDEDDEDEDDEDEDGDDGDDDNAGRGPQQHWVPRVNLCFQAEDPLAFARRHAEAHAARAAVEAQLRKQLYVDCMPVEDIPPLSTEQVWSVLRLGCGMRPTAAWLTRCTTMTSL
jgi:hypothetical protein